MSVTSGFFNSLNHDRRYDALTVSRLFDGMIVDGVYSTIGEKFIVTADSGMRVMVGSGRCWFDHTWTLNDTKYPLVVEESEQVLSRIDAVVLEVNQNEDVRQNSIKIIKGTPSSSPVKPTMIKSTYLNQWPFAYITVGADVTEITQSNIENVVGTDECPFATALLEHVTTSELILQWKAQWDEYIAGAEAAASAWTQAFELRLANWAAGLRDVLDTEAAGHLQNEIDALCDMLSYVEYVDAIDKTTVIASKSYKYGDTVIVNYGNPVSPKLYFAITDIAIGTQIIPDDNVVSDRVMDRINKMYKTEVFKIHDWGWDINTIHKWGKDLFPYVLRVNDIFIPDGHMPDARSCGLTVGTPATDEELDAFNELIDKGEVDKQNKIITLYSESRLPTFYIALNGISGDVDGEISYDVTTIQGIKTILNDRREERLITPGMELTVTLTDNTEIVLVVVAVNHDPDYPHQVIFSTKDCLPTAYPVHSANDNTVHFVDTTLGVGLNGAYFYDLLPFSVKNYISDRTFWRADGGANVSTLHQETAKIWIPRVMEVVGTPGGGSQTEADACAGRFPYYETQANCVKNVGTAAQYWKLCTPTFSNATQAHLMNTNGSLYGHDNLTNGRGIAPHFHVIGD